MVGKSSEASGREWKLPVERGKLDPDLRGPLKAQPGGYGYGVVAAGRHRGS